MIESLNLIVKPESYGIVRLTVGSPIPDWVGGQSFWSVTSTEDEISIVCPDDSIPKWTNARRGWALLEVVGPLDLSLVGVLASLTELLASAACPVFTLSTHDTDYLFVPGKSKMLAIDALRGGGHTVSAAETL